MSHSVLSKVSVFLLFSEVNQEPENDKNDEEIEAVQKILSDDEFATTHEYSDSGLLNQKPSTSSSLDLKNYDQGDQILVPKYDHERLKLIKECQLKSLRVTLDKDLA